MLFRLQAFVDRHISASNAELKLRISDGSLMIFSHPPDFPSSEDLPTVAEEIYMEMARLASLQQQHTDSQLRLVNQWCFVLNCYGTETDRNRGCPKVKLHSCFSSVLDSI